MKDDIRAKFNDVSQVYDGQRRQLIPCFDDFYHIPVSLIEPVTERPKILDIGAGTGLLTSFFIEKIPTAQITLIDLSDQMLEMAKRRFSDIPGVEYIVDDYAQYDFQQKYDMIISAFSIHHLSDEEKIKLYHKCYSILNPKGIFINCDQVLGETPYLDSLNKTHWRESIEKSGLSQADISAAYDRTKLDREAPLSQQLIWLKEAGFTDVDCVYKWYFFAVMMGRKV
ncbi:class I SAM-dependent methyltransferase [Syntrophobotulus glycolicus]|nr:class I SAM-dependent methyltransferase [Syntrophobotulus glycolicus]